MLNRLSAGRLVKSILTIFAVLFVTLLSARVWDAWSSYVENQRAVQVVAASRQIFTALLNQRPDRSTTQRMWEAEEPGTPKNKAALKELRDAEMPALALGTEMLMQLSFPGQDTLIPALRHSTANLIAMQAEFAAGIDLPKSARRPGLGAAYAIEGKSMQETLQQIAASLFSTIKPGDPFVAQMIQIKQLAWLTRETMGEARLLIATGLAKGSVAADARLRHAGFIGGGLSLWTAIDDAVVGLDVPPTFLTTLTHARATLFGAEFAALQDRLLDALTAHQKPELGPDDWGPASVPKLAVVLDVANAALGLAAERAAQLSEQAVTRLITQLLGLLAAVAISMIGIRVVTGHITRPLEALRLTTDRLTRGDMSDVTLFPGRNDEIAALASALDMFRQQAIAKARIEAEQSDLHRRAELRRFAVEDHILGFEHEIATALSELNRAAGQMNDTSGSMLQIAERSVAGVRSARRAATEASENVAGIAVSTEELSASITEIGRQVAHAAEVSARAVEETQQTDDTVRGLAESASRIGEVVSLINDIAGQTNLLALNATIEAARAGDAGKGFAVVASEVKSLANQTAKATEEIGGQITQVRAVTQAAVRAIQQIRGTIDEVNRVASAIAAGVEQQGTAMQNIASNTQLASDRTREASESVAAVTDGTVATTHSAEAVRAAAHSLGDQAGRLREQVTAFMARIRAA